MVPRNRNPLALNSFATRSENGVEGGTCDSSVHAFSIGHPSVKLQYQRTKDPVFSRISMSVRAFVIAASIFIRFRMMPGSRSSRLTSASPKDATVSGSNPANAFRYPSRLPRIVDQERPA